MGHHRRSAPPAARSTISTTASVARPFTVVATLVAAFVTAQLFLPTDAKLSAAEHGGALATASIVAAPVAARAVSHAADAAISPRRNAQAELPRHSGNGRRVVYSVSHQRVWIVGGAGRVRRTYLVSGRLSQPSPGHYRVFSESRWTSSTVSAETMQYMVRFTHGVNSGTPIGFHSIPRDYNGHPAQSVDDLGKALSHGCIRQRLRDAAYLFHFTHVGTLVVVTR